MLILVDKSTSMFASNLPNGGSGPFGTSPDRWEAMRAAVAALEPFDARPHWGKLFAMDPAAVRGRYPRLTDFTRLMRERDPDGKFRNEFVDRYLSGP